MEIARFFYQLFKVDSNNNKLAFIGSAFTVAPNGGLLTCRHVIDIQLKDNERIAVFDSEAGRLVTISNIIFPSNNRIDLAFIPNAFQRTKPEFFPILSPAILKIGESVYSFGFFAIGGGSAEIEQGYFSGDIVNFFQSEANTNSFVLPFPIIEGMSGSPVLTYHNGPKVVGLAYGNRSSRILASEIFEYKDTHKEFKETVHRIVEFGVAYHCATIIEFLTEVSASEFIVADNRIAIPNLE
jgi:hypothetical protein